MAVDAFMQLFRASGSGRAMPIAGESTDAEFEGACELDSFSLGIAGGETGGEANVNRDPDTRVYGRMSQLDQFSFTVGKRTDSASPDLLRSYCQAKALKTQDVSHYEKVIVTARKSGNKDAVTFLQFTFKEAYVKTFTMELGSGDVDGIPNETVEFCFSYLEMTYWKQISRGDRAGSRENRPIEMFWDFNQMVSQR